MTELEILKRKLAAREGKAGYGKTSKRSSGASPNWRRRVFDPSLMIAPNVGGMIQQGIEKGQQQRQQNMAKGALAALVRDPTNQRALAALAQVDPERAMEFRKTQLQYGDKSHEEWAKIVAHAAKAATTPEAWDATIDQFVQMGHPEAAQLKGKFSPALRQAYMAQGGLDDSQDPQDPGMIREYEIGRAKGLIDPKLSYMQYMQTARPGMTSPVTIPYGSTVTPGGAPGNMPTVSSPDEANRLPPGTQFRMPDGRIGTVPGGAGGNASGGFPNGPYPDIGPYHRY
jgi:hypothetical protein